MGHLFEVRVRCASCGAIAYRPMRVASDGLSTQSLLKRGQVAFGRFQCARCDGPSARVVGVSEMIRPRVLESGSVAV